MLLDLDHDEAFEVLLESATALDEPVDVVARHLVTALVAPHHDARPATEPAALRRAATVATGWYPWNLTPSQFAEHHRTYCEHLAAAGKDRAGQHVIVGFRFTGETAALPSVVERYLQLGADGVNISLRMQVHDYADTMQAVSDALGLAA